MSTGAMLALAPTLAPPAPGSPAAGAAVSEPGTRAFEGVLADTEAASLDAGPVDPGAAVTLADGAPMPDPTPAADAAPVIAAAPAPVAVPPAMDDAATTSVLNALALRVATEAKMASAAAGSVPLSVSTGGTDPAGVAQPPAMATPAALAAASTASLAASMPMLFAAAAPVAGMPASVRGAPSALGGPGVVPLAGVVTAEGDAGSLDQLLSALDALLPSAPTPSAAASSGSGLAPVPMTVTAAPLAPPMPTPPPILAAGEVAKAALEALVEPTADAGGESASNPSTPSTPLSGAAPVFSTAIGSLASSAATAPRADGAQPPIQVPFDSPQWGNELATRVVSLAREQFSEAEIRVTPDELGPIEVKLRFEGDRVHAQFGAISPEAREALTANLHRLREMFAGEGLNLGQAFVGHHGQDAGRRFDGHASRGGGSGGEGDDDVAAIAPRVAVAARRGLLDEFA
ncbi:MAG: flagellar hook-length control protein FliK [Xanthomonadaceae bacterium]|jgi:flagellar hook-length control protein FliK|nr:flagellar hook-length control protein FliK [Xanthomonadaceae bacterium]